MAVRTHKWVATRLDEGCRCFVKTKRLLQASKIVGCGFSVMALAKGLKLRGVGKKDLRDSVVNKHEETYFHCVLDSFLSEQLSVPFPCFLSFFISTSFYAH